MRPLLIPLAALVVVAIVALPAVAKEDGPYRAEVVEQAEVRSGPGNRFYVTDLLPQGETVEVYRREAGDWLAIRPPQRSFSWIPQSDLEMTDEPGIAEVIVEQTSSWIGSRAERIRQHKSHVTLSRGERVEVLGKKQVEGADGQTELWLKIAPPAGEFRHVHASQVRRLRENLAGREGEGGLRPVRRMQREASAVSSISEQETDAEREAQPREPERFAPRYSPIMLSDLTPAPPTLPRKKTLLAEKSEPQTYEVEPAAYQEAISEAPTRTSLSGDGFVPRKKRAGVAGQSPPPGSIRTAAASSSRPAAESRESVAVGAGAGTIASDELSRRLEELDVELSLMLSRDRSAWNLADIKERVQQLVDRGATPAERGQARFMLDKIKQFEKAFDVDSAPVTAAANLGPKKDESRYDGEGWLTEVKSSSRAAAPYALVDKDGQRICFVTPETGRNIGLYVNKHVGIYGRRGLIPDVNAPHILASRVVDLDRLRR